MSIHFISTDEYQIQGVSRNMRAARELKVVLNFEFICLIHLSASGNKNKVHLHSNERFLKQQSQEFSGTDIFKMWSAFFI